MKRSVYKIRGETVELMEAFRGECPYCKYVCTVEASGEGADSFMNDACKHYQDFDFDRLMLIFIKKRSK